MKKNAKVTISTLILFSGLCILSSTYFNTKKHEVFDDMNKLLYEQIVSLDELEEVDDNKPVIIEQPNGMWKIQE